jgi:cystathionine beta-lyase
MKSDILRSDPIKHKTEFLMKYFKERFPKIRVIEPEGTYLVWLDCRQ